MRRALILLWAGALLVAGCSLPPERPVTKQELYKTGVYNNFQVKESPENVLAALNRDGEVVVEATYRGTPYYVKILATARGLKIEVIDR
jgi:hypothetical protein